MFKFCRLYWLHAPSPASLARCAPAYMYVYEFNELSHDRMQATKKHNREPAV